MDPATNVVSAKPLNHDAVFRIEVSLSSRKSSAIVMRTTARLYSLEGTQGLMHMGAAADAEWKSVAYGAPCIQLMKETNDHNSPFKVKIVIAEVESGIALWEEEVGPESKYHAMQLNFHTFVTKGHTFAIQFANEDEGGRMLESLQDLFLQKQKSETVSFDKKPDDSTVFKKPKNIRRLNKKDISAPCNFKHVSGITMQRTQVCEEELRGTIQRKIRSMSLSSLTRSKPRSPLRGDMVDGMHRHRSMDTQDLQSRVERESETEKGSKRGSVFQKFGSLRKSWKKAPSKSSPPDLTEQRNFVRDSNRMSLPSHFRRQVRPGITSETFSHQGMDPHGLNKAVSLSSGDLLDLPSDTVQSPHKSAPIKRRHTMVLLDSSPTRRPDNQQFNYTPYRAVHPRYSSSPHHQPQSHGSLSSTRPYMSDMSLHQNPRAYSFNRAQERQFVDARMYQAAQERQRRVTPDQIPAQSFRRSSLTEAQAEGRISFDERRAHMQARTSNGMMHHQVIPEGHAGFISSVPNGRIAQGAVPPGRGDARLPLQEGGDPYYATIGAPTRRDRLSTQPVQSKGMAPEPDFQYDALTPRNRPLPPTPFDVQIPRPQMEQPANYNPRPSFNGHPAQHYTQQHPQGFSHAPLQHAPTRPPQASAERYHSQVSPSHPHTQISPSHPPARFPPSFQPVSTQMPQHFQKQYPPTKYNHPAQWQRSYPAQIPVQRTGGYQPHHQQQQTALKTHHSTATPNDTNSHYDMLNPQNPIPGVAGSRDSPASQGSDPELAEMTEEVTQQMSRVLEQFDSLLAPREPSRPIMQQTAL